MLTADIPESVAVADPVPEPTVLSGRALAKAVLKSAAFMTAAIISMVIGNRTGSIEFIPVAFIAAMGFSRVVWIRPHRRLDRTSLQRCIAGRPGVPKIMKIPTAG